MRNKIIGLFIIISIFIGTFTYANANEVMYECYRQSDNSIVPFSSSYTVQNMCQANTPYYRLCQKQINEDINNYKAGKCKQYKTKTLKYGNGSCSITYVSTNGIPEFREKNSYKLDDTAANNCFNTLKNQFPSNFSLKNPNSEYQSVSLPYKEGMCMIYFSSDMKYKAKTSYNLSKNDENTCINRLKKINSNIK